MTAENAITPLSSATLGRDPAPPARSPEPREGAPAAAPAPEPTASGVFPLTLQFDAETHRLIIESRDPASGFVVFQVPQKYVIKQLASPPARRGASVDRET